ncbi:MAG: 4-hydroxythreonine-4-phosphate dehydrogenase PdxA [candidate division WOR-3 bacterium]|nr:4-hydroxythreonine-4-phosphate dehydrogenase PdxA [candidate division WOR-3 bacterium]
MKIAVTLGDPSGIGPELILKALPRFLKYKPVVYGNRKILEKTARKLGLLNNFNLLKDYVIDAVLDFDFKFGSPNENTGRVALNSIEAALQDLPDILITAPIVKGVIKSFFKNFVGHTEYLARYFKIKDFAMVGILQDKRIMFYTTHLPIADIPRTINKKDIFKKLILFDRGLRRYFGLKNPKIGVSALNPHGSEFSYGEEKFIGQGIKMAREKGLDVSGPFPADTLFNKKFDGYLVMYHDQGFVYLKAKKGGVNWTLGLPIIRLSPLYGAAIDIAGKNLADATGMSNAIKIGIEMFKKGGKDEKVF